MLTSCPWIDFITPDELRAFLIGEHVNTLIDIFPDFVISPGIASEGSNLFFYWQELQSRMCVLFPKRDST